MSASESDSAATPAVAKTGTVVEVKKFSAFSTLCDVSAGVFAGLCVAPSVTIIDRAIMWSAMGVHPTSKGLAIGVKQFCIPNRDWLVFKREFFLVFRVYCLTYIFSNTIRSFYTGYTKTDFRMPQLVGTNVVNQYTGIYYKDRYFVQMFAPPEQQAAAAKRAIPKLSYLLWVMRDSLTIFASFTLIEPAARAIQKATGNDFHTSRTMAQFACPMGIQLLSTPCHLYGISLANNPEWTVQQRMKMCASQYTQACASRMGRIGAAFGVGGNANTWAREFLHKKFDN